MKLIKNISLTIIAVLINFFTACTPEQYELSEVDYVADDLVEGLAYTVTPDEENPNIIYLKSLLPSSYQVCWEHPQGRSQEREVTLQIPFEGEYSVKFGIQTRGGLVYGNPYTFNISTICTDFIQDELWTLLSGGVGQSKTWYLDINAEGQCKYFVGPLYFYGTDDDWETVTLGLEGDGTDHWLWAADWAGNGSWIFGNTGAMDYGSMTFDLIGGANVTVNNLANGTVQNGTYLLDTENHTMTMTDAGILHDPGRDAAVTQWGNIKILSLTEDYMQLGVIRDNDPNEGPCLLCYNYISKEYSDNWTPETTVNTNEVPILAEDWRDYVEPKTNKVITYKLATDNTPFDWCNLDGSTKNISNMFTVSPNIGDLTLELSSGDYTYKVTTPEGTEISGNYTLNNEGIYTFSNGLPEVQLSTDGRAVFRLGSDNTLRIMSYVTDSYSGALTDLWLGASEVDNFGNRYQYLGYHFVPETAGEEVERFEAKLSYFNESWSFQYSPSIFIAGDGDYTLTITGSDNNPYGLYLDIIGILENNPNMDVEITSIYVDGNNVVFDDDKIARSAGDDPTTARRYIVNPWGDTASDASNYVFNSSISVNIKVTYDTGSPFITE